MSQVESEIRSLIRDHYADVLTDIETCAKRVVSRWDEPFQTQSTMVSKPLGDQLERLELLDRLVAVLIDAVEVAGFPLDPGPVPAPPYVVVGSRGPLLRATIDPGRLVIEFRVFDIETPSDDHRRSNPRYVPLDALDLCVSIE